MEKEDKSIGESRIREAVGRFFYLLPDYPYRIQIEVTTKCNLSCKMCPRFKFNLPEKNMDFELYQRIVDRIEYPSIITLSAWGEPLVHPQIFSMIKYAKEKGHIVSITTNGILLKSKENEVFESGLDRIVFSVDSIKSTDDEYRHQKTNLVLENLEKIMEIRNGKKRPEINLQATIHKDKESDIMDIIEYAGNVGVERIFLARLDLDDIEGLERPNLEEEKEIYRQAEQIGKRLDVQVDHVYSYLEGIMKYFYKIMRRFMYRYDRYCPKTYDYIYITLDGDITPCCNLPRYKLGNVFDEDISSIWKGEKFNQFRFNRDLNKKICGNCDVLKLKHSGG